MKNLLTLILALSILPLSAQRSVHFGKISHTHAEKKRCLSFEQLYKKYTKEEIRNIQETLRNGFEYGRQRQYNRGTDAVVRRIPVVVHVVHNNGAEKISTAQVESQIEVLNDDYRRTNADKVNTPSDFTGVAADTKIEFFLAQKDPNGNATTGINYVQNANYTNFEINDDEQALKSSTQWDPTMYLNIWVVKTITDNGSAGILGFAYHPGGNSTLDGLVIIHDAFGTTGAATAPYNGGRTATHEIGHYLGLDHVWGQSGGCNDDDGINDTPNQSSENSGCPSHPSKSCNNNGDMFMNYMDYVNDNCMNMFSEGQSSVMNGHLDNSTNRKTLYTQSNLDATGYSGGTEFTASFTTNSSADIGETVTLTDGTSGTPTSWNWSFSPDGNHTFLTGSATSQNPTLKFNAAGSYTITLIAADDSSNRDTVSASITINDTTGQSKAPDTYEDQNPESYATTNCEFLHYPPSNDTKMMVNGGTGYISGHNSYGDVAKADYFVNSNAARYIFGVGVNFNVAKSNDAENSTFNLVIYSNINGKPVNSLYSETHSYQDIIDADNKPYFEFSSPVDISKNAFFVSIEFTYKNGDTLAIATNSLNSGNTAFEKWDDDTWMNYSSNQTWQQHAQLWIFPKVGHIVDAAFTPSSSVINVNNQVQLSADNDDGINSYSWLIDDVAQSTSSDPTFTFTQANNYVITLIANGACSSDTSSETITVAVSTEIISLMDENISVYPNPAKDQVNIKSNKNISKIELIDLNGRVLIQTQERQINLSQIENGIYIVSIISESGTTRQMLQVNH